MVGRKVWGVVRRLGAMTSGRHPRLRGFLLWNAGLLPAGCCAFPSQHREGVGGVGEVCQLSGLGMGWVGIHNAIKCLFDPGGRDHVVGENGAWAMDGGRRG
jgi:hypothetical protein